MIFRPINNHIEVEPIEETSIIDSQLNNFEEKGKVISTAASLTVSTLKDLIKVGDIVYFDSWMIARYPDSEGKLRYLVPFDAVRAIESHE